MASSASDPEQPGLGDALASSTGRILDSALDAVVTIDRTGRVVYLNRAAQEVFGYSADELIGEPFADHCIPPDLQARHWAGLLRIVAGGEPRILDRRIEQRAMRRGGDQFPVELTVTQTSDDPLLFTGFVRDLSDLRRAESRQTRMEHLLVEAEALTQMGSWALDLQTGEATWSEGMYRIHGLESSADEPSVELVLELTHLEDRERVRDLLRMVVERPQEVPRTGVSIEYRLVRRDGSVRDVRAHGRVERDPAGKPVRWVGAGQDVTDQRLTERELVAHYAVSQALREWQSFDEGVVDLLRRLATALDMPFGALWTLREEDVLICRAFWRAPDVDDDEFEADTRRTSFRVGQGVPGRAWQARQPIVILDLAGDATFRRPHAVSRLGLRFALALPAVHDDQAIAVLTFYSFDPRPPSERLLRTLSGIGSELGRFLSRRRADLEERRLSPRELDVLRLAAEGNTAPEIAERLVVSPATVKTHFENIYDKLGVTDKAAAVAYGLRVGLIH
jgi:PAS domain S-box-containing protein